MRPGARGATGVGGADAGAPYSKSTDTASVKFDVGLAAQVDGLDVRAGSDDDLRAGGGDVDARLDRRLVRRD